MAQPSIVCLWSGGAQYRFIELAVKSNISNVFKQLKLIYIGDLVQISPSNISSYPNAGKKTLVEITNLLNELSLLVKI